MPERFNWLHLTDLHFGQAIQGPLWPNIREAFFKNLRDLHGACGPWHAVLFTGDLVQSGARDEFERMEAEVLCRLWEVLEQLGSGGAVLLAVPGNHDLQWPTSKSSAFRQLLRTGGLSEVEDEFWGAAVGEYRAAVGATFTEYEAWWREQPFRKGVSVNTGLLPGDFSATLEVMSRRIGIVGLNTTFLQLERGEFRGRLACDVRQLHAACGGDGVDWVAKHDVCLLLTHHGPDWLDTRFQEHYPEINPAGRFAVHLFGHMHETLTRTTIIGGGKPLRQWQGNSLFGLEKYGDPPKAERRHGYLAGSIEFGNAGTTIRHWPRRATPRPNGWRLVPDHDAAELLDDNGTAPELVAGLGLPQVQETQTLSAPLSVPSSLPPRNVLLSSYTRIARPLWDIIDLAGLSGDSHHLAVQRFLLRQLYLPLRITTESLRTDEPATVGQVGEPEEQSTATPLAEERASAQRARIPFGRWLSSALSAVEGYDPGGNNTGGAPVPRLLIRGGPGAGKTTLLRWFATACLLRREDDPDFAVLPDSESLPEIIWLPILVPCRDLQAAPVGTDALEKLLSHALSRMSLDEAQIEPLTAFLLGELEEGRAILLVDGLDEIADTGSLAAFREMIEVSAKRFPRMPILATARIVGYGETPWRLGEGFAHASLAEIAPEEKDSFIDRWCQFAIPEPSRRTSVAERLRRGIHGSERMERLTANPMSLATIAHVQRRVGKLPTRRHRIYWEALGVLLNWRFDAEEAMDPDEALPQLQYLAYAMCDRGVQRLRREEVLKLLEEVRSDCPNIRLMQAHSPSAFLADLVRSTGLLVETSEVGTDGSPTLAYEFGHTTFQEYLAALALLEGRFPGHRQGTAFAERVRPLARRITSLLGPSASERLMADSWREVLRFCVATCHDDDVDPVLQVVLEPNSNEEAHARAILALLCLADEPNVSRETAASILRRFAEEVDNRDGSQETGDTRATLEAASSIWLEPLRATLVGEFIRREPDTREAVNGLLHKLVTVPAGEAERLAWMERQVAALKESSSAESIAAALAIQAAAFRGQAEMVPGLVQGLTALVSRGPAAADAACWALGGLSRAFRGSPPRWTPTSQEFETLLPYMTNLHSDPPALIAVVSIAAGHRIREAVPACIGLLDHSWARVRSVAAEALGRIRDEQALYALRSALAVDDSAKRLAAMGGVARATGDRISRCLLSQYLNGEFYWLDPREPITTSRASEAAQVLLRTEGEVRDRYEILAKEWGLQLEWRSE